MTAKLYLSEAICRMAHEAVERRRSDDAVMSMLRSIQKDITVLNTRLFGNPEGNPGDEGRLVIAERRINNHAKRIQRIERLVTAGAVLIAAAKIAFEHWT